MTSRRALLLGSMGAILSATTVLADQVFRAGTDTVFLNVSVSDAKGRPVSGLTSRDFRVLEDGLIQDVTLFAADPQPIALSILLDASTSMEEEIGIAQEAAIGFCRRMGPADVAQFIAFNSTVEIAQSFTNDLPALESAIRRTRTAGPTALYNALYIALSELRKLKVETGDRIRRQAIIVLSDGDDTDSRVGADDVLDLAKKSNIVVYEIALREREPARTTREFRESEYVLRMLAQSTGGRLFPISDVKELSAVYTQIADELANQYVMGYASKNTRRDGAWRQVSVRTSRPDSVARTRTGYFAPSGSR